MSTGVTFTKVSGSITHLYIYIHTYMVHIVSLVSFKCWAGEFITEKGCPTWVEGVVARHGG